MTGGWRAVALVLVVAAVGAAGTVAVAAAMGMGGSEISHLLALILPAALATAAVALLAGRLLAGASMRQRFLATALVAAAAAIANLGVLAMSMSVSSHDATLVAVLLVYAAAAGAAAALVLARSSAEGVERLETAAERMGAGDLDVRVGPLGAGRELDELAATLDLMASRLQDSHLREREAETVRRDLITTVSHDLRTPLASLRAMVEAIDEGVVDDPPSLRRYVLEMRRAVLQLSGMVDDLFELTQLDAGAIEAETERIRVAEAIEGAVATVAAVAHDKGVDIRTAVDGVGDEACSPRLVRVLQNLLVNAVRHTPADGTIRVEASRDGPSLALVVSDTGEGIAPEALPHVFEPFYRADAARAGGGAGLGLALARRIVEALGGAIDAQSPPAGGATFAVRVPLR
jgi:signal transduction histidine kinase